MGRLFAPRALVWTVRLATVWAVLAGAPALAQTPPTDLPQSQTPLSETEPLAADRLFNECENVVDEASLRHQLSESAQAAMREAVAQIDYEALVQESWTAARFDPRFEQIVDEKIDILRADRVYLERLLDGNVPSRAREMAQRTADLVFESPEFADLQDSLQDEIAVRLEPEVSDIDAATQNAAAACLRLFLGARYAETVQDAFVDELDSARLGQLDTGDVSTSVALNMAGIVAAILAVVFRRLVRRIVASVVRRLAGAIAARLAAWASVVLGVAFLIYELIAGADGVFPVIRAELLSEETKTEIQTALTDELASASPEQLAARAEEIARTMLTRWRNFREDHRTVLDLADRSPAFAAFLRVQPPHRFEALTVVSAALRREAGGDDAAVLAALDDSLLNRAIQIPNIAVHAETWARSGVSIEALVAWRERAGAGFETALRLGLPEIATATAFSPSEIATMLAFEDRAAARAAASLEEPARGELLAAPARQARALAARFSAEEIGRLFDALRPVSAARRETALERVTRQPDLVQRLSPRSASAIAASRSPDRAIALVFDESAVFNPIAAISNVRAVLDGDVQPTLALDRYGWWLAAVLGGPLLIAWWMLRAFLGLFRPRRQTVTVRVEQAERSK